jgi:hypothetical protein
MTFPQPNANVAFVPPVNQVIQENQDNQDNQAIQLNQANFAIDVTALPLPGACATSTPRENQVTQENQDGLTDEDPMVQEPMNHVQEPEVPQVLEAPNKKGRVVPQTLEAPDKIQDTVPFDLKGFRRSVDAQRNTREMILKNARLARPQLNLNWRKLTKFFPDLKSVEVLASVAEAVHVMSMDGVSLSDMITSFTRQMSEKLEKLGL